MLEAEGKRREELGGLREITQKRLERKCVIFVRRVWR
jgi:hypothetical protein